MFGEHPRLRKHKFQSKERECFVVAHGSADVTYTTKGFRSKNMDRLESSLVALLKSSSNPFVAEIFADAKTGDEKMKGNLIGGQFSRSMDDLMRKLNEAKGHFVRCVKPNRLKKPGVFEPKMVLQQLKSLSVLEAVDLRRRGYAYRTTFKEFVSETEYFPLLLCAGQGQVGFLEMMTVRDIWE